MKDYITQKRPKMSLKLCRLSFFVGLLLMLGSEAKTENGEFRRQTLARIGAVTDNGYRTGREQTVAIEMAFRLFNLSSSSKFELLHSHENFTATTSAALNLVSKEGVKAIVGSLTTQEIEFLSERKISGAIPIISLNSAAYVPNKSMPPSIIQMANHITHRMHCIAAIVGRFQWPKVIVIHQHPNDYTIKALSQLSNSLQSVNAEIEHRLSFSSSYSLADQEELIEEKLKKFLTQKNRVFIVAQVSIESAVLLFKKAKKMNMTGNGYVWIVSDEIFDFIDTFDSSFLYDMEGVIGFKTYFNNTNKSFRSFETKFRKMYSFEFPEDNEPMIKPSIFAVRAYDASFAIARAVEKLQGKFFSSEELLQTILATNFKGLSGMVKSKNGVLSQSPTFQIIKLVDKGLKEEVTFWSERLGFFENFVGADNDVVTVRIRAGKAKTVSSELSSKHGERRLKIAVPGQGPCQELVKVSYDHLKGLYISGFSIDVFRAVMNDNTPYEFVPFNNGTYDDMVKAVYNKEYDAAVGDLGIISDRFRYVDFTVAYLETDIVMVVTEEQEKWKKLWAFMRTFQVSMWFLIPTMHLFVSSVIWLIERQNNHELEGLGNMLWFSVSIIFYMHREPVKNGLARLVLGPWLFAILVVTSSFTASLTSMMTISWRRPSVVDVEALKKMDAVVACNGNSYICRYLSDILKFESGKIKKMNSLDDYPKAFENGSIKAAFLISPQAEVFLAKNCRGYTKAAFFKLNGYGFAFAKGSALAVNISASIVELIERKEMPQLRPRLLASFNCSSHDDEDGPGLGPGPFLGLFFICGSIASLVLLYLGLQITMRKLGWTKEPNGVIASP